MMNTFRWNGYDFVKAEILAKYSLSDQGVRKGQGHMRKPSYNSRINTLILTSLKSFVLLDVQSVSGSKVQGNI